MTPFLPFLIFFGVAYLGFYVLLIVLRKLKGFQNIYSLSPQTHQAKKSTVSFGGIGMSMLLMIGSLIFKFYLNPTLLWLTVVFLSFSVIGFVDDFLSVVQSQNKGLSAKHKFLLQCTLSILCLFFLHHFIFSLSFFEWMLYTVFMVGFSNATNLTDGLDGLLTGTSLISLIGFAALFYKINHLALLQFTWVIMIILATFLLFNRNPAKMFMGDTGSLPIGALLAGLAITQKNIGLLVILGAVFLIETLSVMIQVSYFKWKKQRLFLMAPLHHHFELLGLSEVNVVRVFWAAQLGFLALFYWGYLH